ncbi:MAG: fibronectin type III domain-containing protein [Bacteroidales bacterium]|nr:fibronectin type III domain-containing protein [Bacteroidales bacterium]
MKRLLSFVMAIIFAMQLSAQQDSVAIGSGTSSSQIGPVPGYFGNHRSVQLYSSSELNMPMGGVIEAISFELGTVSGTTSNRQVRIYMKEISDTTLPANMTINELANDAYLVYTSPESGEPCVANQWYRFDLQSPFVYSGAGSLYVFLEGDGCASNGGCAVNVKYTANTNKGWTKCWDTTVPDLTSPIASSNSYRTNTRIFYSEISEDYCYPVSGLTLTPTAESVDLSWTSDNNNFEIQYKLKSESWDSENVGTLMSSTTSATIPELLPATFYSVRVRSLCDGVESVWMNANFKTPCLVIEEFPWTETFESAWIEPHLPGTISAPNCWININGDGNATYKTSTTTSGYEGNGVYMYGYSSASTTTASYANKDWFITPVVELTGAEMLSFYAKKSSTSYTPELRIYALDVATNGDMLSAADTVNFILIDSLADLTTTYVDREVLLSDLEGEYRLAFVRNKTIGHGAVYFDNVKISLAPSCERVTNLVTTEVTENSISLAWEGTDGTSSYKLYYRTTSTPEWTVIEDITDNYYTLTDLTSATSYTINVTAVCDDGIETGFILAGNLVVATNCQTFPVPFLEDFETYPAGTSTTCWREAQCTWDSVQAGAPLYGYSNAWATNSSVLEGPHAKINNYNNAKRDWLITPNIDLGDGSTEYDLAFDIAYTDYGNSDPVESYCSQRFGVIVSLDGGSTWDFENAILWTTTPTEGTNERNITDLTNLAQRIKINLSELGYTGVVRIAFYAESLVAGCDNDIHIDNVAVQEHVDCGDMVGNPLVSASSSSSVVISWNDEEHVAATGWIVSYVEGTTNDDPSNATTIEVPYGTEMPYAIEGLTEGETYTFRVQYDCEGGWSSSSTVTLPESMDMFATIPYTHDFEDLDENANWTITNNSYVNRWFIGDPANVAEEGNMLYVSNDSLGVNSIYSNAYATPSVTSYVFASRLLQFDENLAYEISFDFKAQGEGDYDFIKVALRPWNESYVGITSAPTWTVAGTVQEGFEYVGGVAKFNLDTTGARGVIIVDGSVVNNSLQQLVFAWRNDSGGGVASVVTVDNISVEPINCIAPDGFSLAEDGRQLTSLTFDVDTRSGDTWEIQYQEYSDTVWQSVFSTDTEGIEVSNLLPGTMYRFKVRSICEGEESHFTSEVLYQTLCPIISVTDEEPFEEGFELANWFRLGSVTSPNAYAPICWENVDAGSTSYRWQSSTTEPYSGEKYAQLYLTTTAAVDWLITPIFDLAGTETLSFYAKHTLTNAALQSGVSIMYYSVDENGDMSSAADTALFVNLQDVNLTNSYAPYDVALSSLGAGQYRLAFLVSQTATTSHYIRIDNVKVANISCPRPTGEVVISGVTPNTATVSWTDETNTAWNVYYKAEEDSTYQMVSSTETTVELPDLTSHTYYEVYVVASCGDEESEPTLISTFMTPCDYVTELPFFEGFEDVFVTEGLSNAAAPACWLNYNGGYSSTSYTWLRTTTTSSVHEGGASLYSYATSTSPGNDDWIVTPVISNEGGAIVRFFAKVSSTTSVPGITLRYLDVATYGDVTGLADTANFVTIGTINGLTTTFAEYEYILADLPATYRLAFVRQDVVSTSIYIDNLSVVEIPTCFRPDPASVEVSNITQTTATVAWTDSDENNTTWTVYYKASADEEYLSETTTETTVELIDLLPGEPYQVYVTTVCSDGSESDATYTKQFYTLQEAVELPYTCDFEEEDVENGWLIRNGTIVNQWHIGTPTGATSSSLFISNDNGTTAAYTITSSSVVVAEKLFQLGATDSVRISFDLTIGGESSYDYLKVYWLPADTTYLPASTAYYGNSSYVNNVIMNNYTGTSNYRFVNLLSGTQNMSVTLENNPNELRKLVFVWKNDGSGGNQQGAIIDNIMIEPVGEEITCTKPVANSVVASAITSTSAVISWTDNDESHTAWNVYYKTEVEEEYSVISASETTIEFTTLDPATVYSVYVTTDCGSGDESEPTDTIVFMTECLTVDEFPYNEGFNSTAIPCWSTVPVNQTYNWAIAATYQGDVTPAEGEAFAIFKNNSRGSSARLTSPIFDLTSLTNPTLDFMYIAKMWVSDLDELKVQYRTSAEEEWVDLVHYNTEETAWSQKTITLPNPSATYQIAFLGISDFGYGAAIDNVVVYDAGEGGEDPDPDPEPEPCDAPTALAASNITETTADITWNGTASTYEFKLNSGAAETLTTTSKALTGLTANTAYTVEVRAVCEDAESDWVTTTFTTLEEIPEIIAPVVTTTEATSVTHESAVLNGTITAGSEEITAQGFRYKTATASEWIEVSATGTTISTTVNNLTAETAYVFKAFATTASGTVEGTEMTFTTIAAPIVVVEGEVTTTPATNIANTSATLNGALVSAGNSENYTIGFALATVADFTLEDAGVQNITATLNGSTFSQAVNDLVEGQTYFYRAYITNEAGTAYGTVETFTLLGLTDALANQIAVSLYPNPASDNATLDINGLNQDAKIVISDLQGRILSQDNINAGTTRYTINVSDMTSGVYYIRIITDNVVSTQKLIVE